MFWARLLKFLLIGPPRSGYSVRGFWGEIKHFNKYGIQIGYTVKGFWGQRKRYDMEGNLKSVSWRNFWGGYDTYDAEGNLIRRSYKNFWRGYSTYNRNGKKIVESYRNFWEGFTHFDVENPDPQETSIETKKFSIKKRTAGSSETKKVSTKKHTDSSSETKKFSIKKRAVSSTANSSEHKKLNDDSPKKQAVLKTSENKQNFNVVNSQNDHQRFEQETSVDKSESVSSFFEKKQNFKKKESYYANINEYLKGKNITQYVKLLVFQYQQFTEFPVIAYRDGDKIKVEALQMGIDPFEFSVLEIEKVQEESVANIDMSVFDDEFSSCMMSDLGKEFEDLVPEYSFENNGISRIQYKLDCGMIITEKSMKELRDLVSQL